MATIAGYDGEIDWSDIAGTAATFHTHSWSLDLAQDQLDNTDFSSTGWRSNMGGLKGWTGTLEMYVDSVNFVQPSDVGTEMNIKLYMQYSDVYLTGSARCSGWSPSIAVEGIQTQTLNFQGNGTITFSDNT